MEHAPLCQSFTSLYLRCATQPSTSQEGGADGGFGGVGWVAVSAWAGNTETGTENVMTTRRSSEPSMAGSFAVDTQRYMVGGAGVWLPVSSLSSTSSMSIAIDVSRLCNEL